MQAVEYARMLQAVPTRHGLAAVGQAFLLEAGDRARRLNTRVEIEAMATDMVEKWREFCALMSDADDVDLKPQAEAFDGLPQQLLSARGF